MARLVKFHKRKPFEVQGPQGTVYVCQCGLSKNFPFCDSSHKQCVSEEEGKLYRYGDSQRTEIQDT